MNNDKLRVAIAVACGWRWREIGDTIEWIAPKRYSPPDYPNDLNAMHEAEKTLENVRERHDEFRDALKEICLRDALENKHYTVHAVCATALQRAEAFARVMGILEDGE